jgi:thiosulfate/3-mercaptopyruvate sulfurtransferase
MDTPHADATPRSDLLIEPHRVEPEARLLDLREASAAASGHIPGSAAPGLDVWCKADGHRGGMASRGVVDGVMAARGIDLDTPIVVYDDRMALFAARFWWVASQYGYRHVRVLDGGWQRWVAEGRPVSAGPPRSAVRTDPAAAAPLARLPAARGRVASLEDVRARLGHPDVVLLDVRRRNEWTGEDAYGNRRIGHLPGATHLLWSDLMTPGEQPRFRTPEDMARVLTAAGVTPDKEVVVYCQAAIRAAHTAFALELLGYPRVLVYEGSMSEWANRDDTPLTLD